MLGKYKDFLGNRRYSWQGLINGELSINSSNESLVSYSAKLWFDYSLRKRLFPTFSPLRQSKQIVQNKSF